MAVIAVVLAFSIFSAALNPSPSAPSSPPVAAKSFAEQLRQNEQCQTTPKQDAAVQALIKMNGYDCATVDAACRYLLSEGFTVYCNGGRYTFEIENHGGRWSVNAR